MYKTDAAGNVSNEFSDAGSSTRVDAAFMNEIMYEIINVLVAASITPVKGTRTQLRDAINALIAAAGSIPDATETVKGKVELATNAEAIAGSDAVRAIVPTSLKAVVDLYAKLSTANTFSGQIAAPSFNTTSSKRWKKLVKNLDPKYVESIFDKLRIVEYVNKKTKQKAFGVIAEEIVDIGLDHAVTLDDEGLPASVNYNTLFVLSMLQLKTERKKTSTLEKRIAKIESNMAFAGAK